VALALSLLAVLYLLFFPTYSGVMSSQDSTGVVQTTTTSSTILEVNGWSALLPMLFPVVICAATLALRSTPGVRLARVIAAVLLMGFAIVAGFSIGLFYIPRPGDDRGSRR
jgi:hypothetical protein